MTKLWQDGGLPEGRWDNTGPSGEELARVQRGIAGVMADVVGHGAPRGPSSILGGPSSAAPKPAVAKEIPLGPRLAYELELIDAMAKKFVGGPNESVK